MVKSYMGCCAATFSIHSRVCYSKKPPPFLAEFEVSDGFLDGFFVPFPSIFRGFCAFFHGEVTAFFGFFWRASEPPGEGQRSLQGLQRKRFAGGGNVARADDWRVFFPGVGLAVGVYDSLWFTMFRIQTRIFSHYVTMFRIHYVTMLGFTLW